MGYPMRHVIRGSVLLHLYTGPNEGLPSSVPEPSSFVLVGSGIAGLGMGAWRRKRSK